MFSMPPARITSLSPSRIAWAASAIVFRPEPHTLLTVIDGRALRQARAERGLPRRVLAEPRRQHVAHQHLVDAVDAGAAQRLLRGDRAQLWRWDVDECTAHGADGGAHSADDDRVLHA